MQKRFNPKKYFDKTGYIYGVMRRWKDDGTMVKCGVVYFNNYDEAKRWLHFDEQYGFNPEGYGKSLVSHSQAYGFIHFK